MLASMPFSRRVSVVASKQQDLAARTATDAKQNLTHACTPGYSACNISFSSHMRRGMEQKPNESPEELGQLLQYTLYFHRIARSMLEAENEVAGRLFFQNRGLVHLTD
ncbi:hypothetical protein BGZ65_012665, partial [Modicella reniformis]